MRNLLRSAALLAALVLAGCTGDDGGPSYEAVTCPDGTVLSPEQVEQAMLAKEQEGHDGHGEGNGSHGHDDDMDLAAQVCPEEPSVMLDGIPASLQAFKSAPFRWSLDPGSLEHAHSMLTSIRWHTSSVAEIDLTNVNKYPNELIKREHQDLPVSYEGNLTFSRVGAVYLRAYAEIGGEDFWSDEVRLDITAVPPTGTVHTVTFGPGAGLISEPDPAETTAVLGDAIQISNEDPLLPRSCSATNGPMAVGALDADAGATSAPVLLLAPGLYEFSCDTTPQATSFRVSVALA